MALPPEHHRLPSEQASVGPEPSVSLQHASGPVPSAPAPQKDGPVPMSLPAILRNPRLRHLQQPPRQRPSPSAGPGVAKNDPRVGKRRMRRTENSRFASNPHTVRPTASDYEVRPNSVRSTFEVQNDGKSTRLEKITESYVPDFASPQHDSAAFEVSSAMSGQFTISLRDAQQFLRARQSTQNSVECMTRAMDAVSLSAPSTLGVPTNPATFIEQLIATAEREISTWLQQTVHLQNGEGGGSRREILTRPSSSVRDSTAILELRRTPSLLVWHIDDAYNRLAVHCVARVLDCPSFSRAVLSGERAPGSVDRHTWILHPNPLVRGKRARRAIAQRPVHNRTSSTSTAGSVTSSAVGPDPDALPLTAGILQHSFGGLNTPPVTDYEYTSTEEFTESDRGETASDVDL